VAKGEGRLMLRVSVLKTRDESVQTTTNIFAWGKKNHKKKEKKESSPFNGKAKRKKK